MVDNASQQHIILNFHNPKKKRENKLYRTTKSRLLFCLYNVLFWKPTEINTCNI